MIKAILDMQIMRMRTPIVDIDTDANSKEFIFPLRLVSPDEATTPQGIKATFTFLGQMYEDVRVYQLTKLEPMD